VTPSADAASSTTPSTVVVAADTEESRLTSASRLGYDGLGASPAR